MLLRIRLSSFLAGVAVAGSFSLYQIRQDIQKSHELLSAQAEGYDKGLEQRVNNLEVAVSQLQK